MLRDTQVYRSIVGLHAGESRFISSEAVVWTFVEQMRQAGLCCYRPFKSEYPNFHSRTTEGKLSMWINHWIFKTRYRQG
jgi:hypothetical protein